MWIRREPSVKSIDSIVSSLQWHKAREEERWGRWLEVTGIHELPLHNVEGNAAACHLHIWDACHDVLCTNEVPPKKSKINQSVNIDTLLLNITNCGSNIFDSFISILSLLISQIYLQRFKDEHQILYKIQTLLRNRQDQLNLQVGLSRSQAGIQETAHNNEKWCQNIDYSQHDSLLVSKFL